MKWINKSSESDGSYCLPSIPRETRYESLNLKKTSVTRQGETLAERNPGDLHCLIREISDRKKANAKAVPPEEARCLKKRGRKK